MEGISYSCYTQQHHLKYFKEEKCIQANFYETYNLENYNIKLKFDAKVWQLPVCYINEQIFGV